MRERLNCPNCGAPITSNECEFCGTMFYDFATLEVGKVGYIRININGVHHIVRAVPVHLEAICEQGEALYANNETIWQDPPKRQFTIEFDVLPDDRGVMVISRRYENRENERGAI